VTTIKGDTVFVPTVPAEDPFPRMEFLFRNRRAMAVKVLAYDGQAFEEI